MQAAAAAGHDIRELGICVAVSTAHIAFFILPHDQT